MPKTVGESDSLPPAFSPRSASGLPTQGREREFPLQKQATPVQKALGGMPIVVPSMGPFLSQEKPI